MKGICRVSVHHGGYLSFIHLASRVGVSCLTPLVLALGLPVHAEDAAEVEFNEEFLRSAVDISQFSHGNPVAAGSHRINLYLNERWVGRKDVNFTPAPENPNIVRPCYDLELLQIFNIALDKLDKDVIGKLQAGEQCSALEELVPGAKATFDNGEQRLDVVAPQIILQRQARGYVSPALWDNGITAGTLQYDYNAYHSEQTGTPAQTSQYLSLRGGFNWDAWRLRYRSSADWDNNSGFSYHSNETYLERSIVPWRSKLVLGQSTTDGQVFNSLGFLGVQLSSDDRMYTDSQRGFAPVIQGTANTNARVRVSQRGNQIYETTVSPGAFVIDDLYPTGSGGDLLVTIREADGSERSFTVTYATIAELLRPGVTRFSLMAGKYRNSGINDQPVITMATLRHGISNLITGYTGVIGAENYAAVSAGLALNTDYGAISLDITQSQAKFDNMDNQQGQSVRFTYAKILPVINTNVSLASYSYSSSGYFEADEAIALRDYSNRNSDWDIYNNLKRRNRLQVNATQQFAEGFGALSLNMNTQNYWNRGGTDTEYQFSYNNFYQRVNYGINFERVRNLQTDRWDNRVMLTVSIPLGSSRNSPHLTTSYTQDRDRQALQNSVGGSFGEAYQYSYNTFINAEHYQDNGANTSGGLSGSWSAPYATVGGSYSKGDGYSQYGANMSGGIVAYSGGVVLTPMLGETSAIVEADNAKGIRVTNYSGLQLDSRGRTVVPYLSPFRQNSVELDPKGLSSDVELKYTTQYIAPTAGAVTLLRYETETGYSLLTNARDAKGNPLPFGATVTDEKNNNVGYIAQSGQGFLRVKSDKGRLDVKWGEGADENCQFNYQLPQSTSDSTDYRRADVVCN
ncbi:fimbria/pilus outer membrane usher protein [Edaphovirga cremea]|uniref:fimbria/pilus outer membrane usher protein n=1 Tax=Edaphovirga cremea TaxID=2267246 RepID=UPI000DEEDB7C|nr:fimbria/pilus outer membrane usher protein [Edaphovirga cremea]